MRNRKEIEEIVFRILEPTNLIIDVKQDLVDALTMGEDFNIDDAKEMITAWESLPEGYYDTETMNDWLVEDMKPVIDKFRNKLKN